MTSPTATAAASSIGLFNPDRAGKVHRPHDRFSSVTTACGGSRVFVPYVVDIRLVDAEDYCPKCWPAIPTPPESRSSELDQ